MTDSKITIEFNLRTEHIQDFYVYHELKSKERKRNLLKDRIILFIFLFIIFFLLISNYDNSYLSSVISALIYSGFIFLILMMFRYREKQIREKIIKLLNKPENRNLLGPIKYEFDINGIRIKTDISESYYKWDCITKTITDNRYFFLYMSSLNAIQIPKNVFNNDLDKQRFIELLNKNNDGQKSNTHSDCPAGSERD